MAGNSYTALNSGSGGDNIYDEDIGGSPVVKMQAGKIHTGAVGVDGGPVTTANPFPVRGAVASKFSYTTLAVNGVQVFSGAGSALFVFDINTTGGSEFLHFFDATATQENGTPPLQTTPSIASNAFLPSASGVLGQTFYGFSVTTGLWLQPSTTQNTMTKLASSTSNSGYVIYLLG